jgi:hypothetical protein
MFEAQTSNGRLCIRDAYEEVSNAEILIFQPDTSIELYIAKGCACYGRIAQLNRRSSVS